MKLKNVLGTALVLSLGVAGVAHAKTERLTVYEVNTFMTKFTNAMNNPDPRTGQSFLNRSLDKDASFYNKVVHGYDNWRYHQPVWDNQYGSSWYRYPYANNRYHNVIGHKTLDKDAIVADFLTKKNVIPRYTLETATTGIRMPAEATSAIVDVNFKEFGLHYSWGPYGRYDSRYQNRIKHSEADCKLHLEKERGLINVTYMNCDTVVRGPY